MHRGPEFAGQVRLQGRLKRLLTAVPVSIDPCVLACGNETIFEGSEIEGALSRRLRHTQGGGSEDLLGVGAYHKALVKETSRDWRCAAKSDPWQALQEGHSAQRVAAPPPGGKRGPHSRRAQRGFRGGVWAEGLHLHRWEGHHQPARWRWLASHFDARRLVFVDESGFHTSMTRLRARAPKGKRAYGKVPKNRGKNTTLIAAITLQGAMGESMTLEGATDSYAFEAYVVEHFLAPSLSKGQVVVLDGLGAHRPKRIRELIEERGADLLFLPSYSPDLNPIEEAFSKVKALVRKEGARVREALVEAIQRRS